jgi:hypothetical protein
LIAFANFAAQNKFLSAGIISVNRTAIANP